MNNQSCIRLFAETVPIHQLSNVLALAGNEVRLSMQKPITVREKLW